MTNESYIIVAFCQSILMNLSFHKNNWEARPLPPANYGRYAYDCFYNCLVVSTICYIAVHCGYELDEICPIFSTLQLLHVQCTNTLLCIYNYTLYLARFVHKVPEGMFDLILISLIKIRNIKLIFLVRG